MGHKMNSISDSSSIPDDDLIAVVFRYWEVILVILIVSGVTGFLYFLNATPVYTSKAKIYFPNIERPKDAFFLYAQTKSIVTYFVIEEAIKEGHLDKLETFENISHPASYIAAKLDVSVGKKDGLISISFDSEYPSDAATIVNAIVKSYITFYIVQEQQKCSNTQKALEEEKAENEQALLRRLGQDSFRQNGIFVSNSSLENENRRIVILEDARPAVFPSRPDKDRILITFLGMGLIIGCGTAVVCNYFASRD